MTLRLQQAAVSSKSQHSYTYDSLLEQGTGASNEDALLVRENLFGVFDGASSLKGSLYRGQSGAWWAAHLARSVFSANDASLSELAERANQLIARGMRLSEVDMQDRLQLWSTSAAVVKVHDDAIEYVQVGDALILCIFQDGSFCMPVPFHNHDSHIFKQWRMLIDFGFENALDVLRPQVEQVRLQMNRSFGVLNGESEMQGFLRSGKISIDGLAHILVFTDGLHMPGNSSGGVDFAGMVDCYHQRGLSGLYHAVRGIERSDPKCLMFPRFKVHDDVAAVALTF
ncbi:MAG: hypothetical protein C0618_10720 [Desulfuromonas sp.]|nr:MAG: hypothetical protein C0618_10720 [Desulfuromonas sp.]